MACLRPILIFSLFFSGAYASADVVINEILYHPKSDDSNEEFIELFNTSSDAVDLSGWAFTRGITFIFPDGSIIPGKGFLVVAREPKRFAEVYGDGSASVVGGYVGQLSNAGERITLTDSEGRVRDDVDYSDESPWNPDADGSGRSLECIDPTAPNDDFRNWVPSAVGSDSRKGTPGRLNSVAQEVVPPFILRVVHDPPVAGPDEPVQVVATVENRNPVSVRLFYDVGEGYIAQDMELLLSGGLSGRGFGDYAATIPGQNTGTLVRYYVETINTGGGVRRFPPEAPTYGRGWKVLDPNDPPKLPRDEVFLDPIELKEFFDNPYDRFLEAYGSCVLDGVLYDNVQIRLRGAASRDFRKRNWRINFPKSHRYQGNQRRINFNCDYHDASHMRNVLSMELLDRLGLPVAETQYIRLHFNEAYFGLYYRIEHINEEWLIRVGRDPDADLYKSIHDHTLPAFPDLYPLLYDKKTGEDEEDYSSIRTFIEGLNAQLPHESGPFLQSVFDMDSLLNYTVVRTLLSDADDRYKNHFLYLNSAFRGGLWEIFPHDWDLTWGHVWDPEKDLLNANFVTDMPSFFFVNRLLAVIEHDPELRAEYYRRLRIALDEVFREEIWVPRINEIYELIREAVYDDTRKWETNETFDAQHRQLTEYIALRRQYLLNVEIPAGKPPATPTPMPVPTEKPASRTIELADLSPQAVPGFDPPEATMIGPIPVENAPPGMTDGSGLTVAMKPGQGVFLIANQPVSVETFLVELAMAAHSTSQSVQIGLVAFAYPVDGSFGYVNPVKREVPLAEWREIRLIYNSPGLHVLPGIQLVVPPEAEEELVSVFIDRFRISPFDTEGAVRLRVVGDASFDSADDLLSGYNPNMLVPEGAVPGDLSLVESLGGKALRFSLEPEQLATNVSLFSLAPRMPVMVHGSAAVKRARGESGTFAFVITDGEQTVGHFLSIDHLPVDEYKEIWMGGNFEVGDKAMPPFAVLQLGGPNVSASIDVDRFLMFTSN